MRIISDFAYRKQIRENNLQTSKINYLKERRKENYILMRMGPKCKFKQVNALTSNDHWELFLSGTKDRPTPKRDDIESTDTVVLTLCSDRKG